MCWVGPTHSSCGSATPKNMRKHVKCMAQFVRLQLVIACDNADKQKIERGRAPRPTVCHLNGPTLNQMKLTDKQYAVRQKSI